MIYKAENIDTDKFLEQLRELESCSYSQEFNQKKEIEKYNEGYRTALYKVRDMFYCKNYEKKEK